MTRDIQKSDAFRRLINSVADSLEHMRSCAKYERFNDCYNETIEVPIEWLEALLSKLASMEKGNYPRIGYLGHVGRLVKEYAERYLHQPKDRLLYPEFMEYWVADGFLIEYLEEHGIPDKRILAGS